jgi:reticulon-4-interacting protein 1, mitochondrial
MEKTLSPSPATMLAWIQSRAGRPSEVLSLSSDVPTPATKEPTDVLIRISHAALNPGASIMMQLCPFFFRSNPSIPELDFSGTLVAAGSTALKSGRLVVGDSVFGSVGTEKHIKEGSGSLAQFVVVPEANVAPKPSSNATDAEAAGLGIAGCTAVALMEKARLQNGNSVLVNGASGGIGSMVVQMARDAVGTNGRVVAICSGTNAKMVKELGADEVRPLPSTWILLLASKLSQRQAAVD